MQNHRWCTTNLWNKHTINQMPRRKQDACRRAENLNHRRYAKGQAMANEELEREKKMIQQMILNNEDDNYEGLFDPDEDEPWLENALLEYERSKESFDLQWQKDADQRIRRSVYIGTSKSSLKKRRKKEALKSKLITSFFSPLHEPTQHQVEQPDDIGDAEEGGAVYNICSDDDSVESNTRRARRFIDYNRERLQELRDEILINSPLVHDNADLERRASNKTGAELFQELCVGRYFDQLLNSMDADAEVNDNNFRQRGRRVRESEICAEGHFRGQNGLKWKARRIRKWADDYYEHGHVVSSNRGKHSKILSPIDLDSVRDDCLSWLRDQNPNQLTSLEFKQFLDNYLADKGFLAEGSQLCSTTAIQWMHKLNFKMWDYKKGLYYDGHERVDVVAYRKVFLAKMLEYENRMVKYIVCNVTGEETTQNPTLEPNKKISVMVVHDECCFSSHDGRKYLWVEGDKGHIRKKGQGKSIMVSEFLYECHGHMRISLEQATENGIDPGENNCNLIARFVIHPGQNDDGYWKNEDVARQLRDSVILIFIHRTITRLYFVSTIPAITTLMPPMLCSLHT